MTATTTTTAPATVISDGWVIETFEGFLKTGYATTGAPVFDAHSDFQHVQIVPTQALGNMLLLDGCMMTTERDEFIYHEMITHMPLLAHPNPQSILIIGGGDGGAVREALKHPSVTEVVLCEIDGMVIDACRQHLPTIAGPWLDDARVTVKVADGIAYVRDCDRSFDVILVDSTDPTGPGEVLFSPEFYQNAARILNPGGIMVNQTESPIAMPAAYHRVQRRLKGIFSVVAPYTATIPTYPGGLWSWTFCSNGVGPLENIRDAAAAQLEQTTRYYNRQIHRAAFALPNFMRQADRPILNTAANH
ncbi:MAG: polyamine aminopropyltransferase [Vampirovibrionales bacterium]|nr:polyamine aminopropyltransferase [Vampirovibrionales bacterium]